MLPLGLLKAAYGSPILVELKSGETLNGHLVACDTWMNLTLSEVVHTSFAGTSLEKFEKIPEIYVKGSFIKYLQIQEKFIEQIKDTQQQYRMDNNRQRYNNNNNRSTYSVKFVSIFGTLKLTIYSLDQRGSGRGGRGGRNNYNNRNYQNNNANRGTNRYNNPRPANNSSGFQPLQQPISNVNP